MVGESEGKLNAAVESRFCPALDLDSSSLGTGRGEPQNCRLVKTEREVIGDDRRPRIDYDEAMRQEEPQRRRARNPASKRNEQGGIDSVVAARRGAAARVRNF